MSRNMDGATGFKKPSEFLNHLWQLDQLKSNPDFSDMDPADLILDENGEQLKVEDKKLSEYLKDPALNYFGKTLDSFLNSYMKENPNKSLNVIGQDAKPHAIGVKSMNGNGDVSEFGYIPTPEPAPKKPGLWARFLNLFVPQKEVQDYKNYQKLQSSPIMRKCQNAKTAMEDRNRVISESAPKVQQETKQKEAEPALEADKEISRIDTPDEAGLVLGGDATGKIMDKLKDNGMFKTAQRLYQEIRDKDADLLTDSQNEICMFAENMMVSMQALEDYASRPDGVNLTEVKQHIANVVTFGLVAGDPKKEFQILNGTTAEDLAESVAKSDSFQNILKNYSTIPGAEKSLVDLARNVSKGQVGEIAKPFRDSLTSVRESMNKAPETKTVQKTNTKTVEAKENVL